MSLCLDSSIAVEILRPRTNGVARGFMQAALEHGQSIWIGSIVVHELMIGALRNERAPEEMQRLNGFLSHLSVAEFTGEDAIAAARVRLDLEKSGAKIGPLDTLIAGQAVARDWTLVTRDLEHFLRVDGLTIIDWTRSDEPFDRSTAPARMPRPAKDPK